MPAAARAVEAMVAEAGTGDVVLVLVSGGGSAMLPAPVAGVTLADKAAANRVMLGGGLDITRMNLVRQAMSRLKGGGLVRLAAPARVAALILSDVIGDDLRVVASGPTVAPIGTRAEARAMLCAAGLWAALPEAVRGVLGQPDEEGVSAPAENRLIGSNALSVRAMARATGGTIWSEALEGDVGAAALWLAEKMRVAVPGIYLCGGETTVVVRGAGLGPDQQRDERGYLIEPEERSGGGWGGGVDGGNFGL